MVCFVKHLAVSYSICAVLVNEKKLNIASAARGISLCFIE